MIIYGTKKTMERYKLPLPEQFEDPQTQLLVKTILQRQRGDRLMEWGAKLFYLDGRKCLQVMNFASKLTILLVNFKMKDREYLSQSVSHYIYDLYEDDPETIKLIERYFRENPLCVFDKLTDRSAIASLNHLEIGYLQDGYALYRYIWDGILHTHEANRDLNHKYPVTIKKDGKTEYIFPAEYFAKLLKERYKDTPKAARTRNTPIPKAGFGLH